MVELGDFSTFPFQICLISLLYLSAAFHVINIEKQYCRFDNPFQVLLMSYYGTARACSSADNLLHYMLCETSSSVCGNKIIYRHWWVETALLRAMQVFASLRYNADTDAPIQRSKQLYGVSFLKLGALLNNCFTVWDHNFDTTARGALRLL